MKNIGELDSELVGVALEAAFLSDEAYDELVQVQRELECARELRQVDIEGIEISQTGISTLEAAYRIDSNRFRSLGFVVGSLIGPDVYGADRLFNENSVEDPGPTLTV